MGNFSSVRDMTRGSACGRWRELIRQGSSPRRPRHSTGTAVRCGDWHFHRMVERSPARVGMGRSSSGTSRAERQGKPFPFPRALSGLAWSPDGRYLASGELDRAFWVWDVEQHKQRTTFYGTMAPVRALAFSPDSSTLNTAHEDGGMQVWDMSTGQCIRKWQGFACTVSDVAWSPNSAQIAGGGNDGLVTIWDVAQRVPLHLLRGHKAMIWGVSWSPDGRWLASCSEDNTIRIWDVATAASERVLTDAALVDAQLFATAWSPDGERLAVATHRQGVLVYDMHTRTFQRVGRSAAPPRIRRVAWSPDGKYLAASGEGGLILVWNSGDYSLRATLEGQRGMVTALAWTADGTRLASGSWGHGSDHLLIWDTQSWQRIRMLDDPNELVFGVAWSADGERLVSAGSDGILRWWNPQNGSASCRAKGTKDRCNRCEPVLTVASSPVAATMERSRSGRWRTAIMSRPCAATARMNGSTSPASRA